MTIRVISFDINVLNNKGRYLIDSALSFLY